jgi:hypothetical protein
MRSGCVQDASNKGIMQVSPYSRIPAVSRRAAARRSPQAILDSRSGLEKTGSTRTRRRGPSRGAQIGKGGRVSVIPITVIPKLLATAISRD